MAAHNRIDTLVARARNEFETRFKPLMGELGDIAHANGLTQVESNLVAAFEQLRNEKLRILVLGKFNNGKSTLLNALLASTMNVGVSDIDRRILPMERVPSTPVLTRIVYGETLGLTAHRYDGASDEISLESFKKLARIYGETVGEDGTIVENEALRDICSFELRLPHPLLALGLELGDTPGLGEDPRRNATTKGALLEADGAIVVLRSDVGLGIDERDAAAEVLATAGHVFPLVNTFNGEFPCDREQRVFMSKLAGLRSSPGGHKLDPESHWVDARGALQAREQGNVDRLSTSRMLEFEHALGEFLVTKAYGTKKQAALDKGRVNAQILEEGLTRLHAATLVQRDALRSTVETCRRDLQAMQDQRDRVHRIFQRLREDTEAISRVSYQRKCADLQLSIDGLFARQKLDSSESVTGRLSELVSGRLSKEAIAKLKTIIEGEFEVWASAPDDRPGLLQDLAPSFENARIGLDREMKDFSARLNDISIRMNGLPEMADGSSVLLASERLVSVALGVVFLGPVFGPLYGATGWRGFLGSLAGVAGTKAVLATVATALGVTFSGPLIVAAVVSAVLLGGVAGGLHEIEARVRRSALEKIKPVIQELGINESVITDIRKGLTSAVDQEAAVIIGALDNVLTGQQQQITEMLRISESSLAEREQTRSDLEAQLARVRDISARFESLSDDAPAPDLSASVAA